jgi:hypothetical protein
MCSVRIGRIYNLILACMIMGWHGAALLARSAWLNVVGQNQPKS